MIRKKRKGVKGVPLDQKVPLKPVDNLLLCKKEESLDDMFLKSAGPVEPKEKSPFDDFLKVKRNEKRSGQTKHV